MRRLYQGVRQASSCGVSVQHITQLIDRARIEALQHLVNDRRNAGKVQAPLEKRLYRDLVGRVQHRRRRSRRRARRPARARCSESAHDPAPRNPAARSRPGRAIVHRNSSAPAMPSACAIGVRMSGAPSWASIEPSAYSTSECTMLCGCTTMSTCDSRQPEQQRGLDDLQPLVHERRRIHRDLAAHFPFRVRAGLLRRHVLQIAAAGVQRNGPPEAVRITRVTPRAAAPGRYPAGMHWKIALCSLSIGISSVLRAAHLVHEQAARTSPAPPCSRAARACRRAPRRASAPAPRHPRSRPSRCRRRRRPRPPRKRGGAAFDPRRQAACSSAARASRGGVGVDEHDRIRPEARAPARTTRLPAASGAEHEARGSARGAARSPPGCCLPMLPGRTQDRDAAAGRSREHSRAEQAERIERRRGRDAVDAVQHAPVARQQCAAILEAGSALEHALGQITDHRKIPTAQPKADDGTGRQAVDTARRPGRWQDHRAQPADGALPGLARADARRELAPPESRPRRKRRCPAPTTRRISHRTIMGPPTGPRPASTSRPSATKAGPAPARRTAGRGTDDAAPEQRSSQSECGGPPSAGAPRTAPADARARRSTTRPAPEQRDCGSIDAAARQRSSSPPNPAHSHAPISQTSAERENRQRGASRNKPASNMQPQDRRGQDPQPKHRRLRIGPGRELRRGLPEPALAAR